MEQVKIGKFIAECRKKQNLTQMQLAEKLGITDKAVSKWERGIAMPDSSLMLELCGILNITVNDLLSGEVVTMENYNKEIEQKLIDLVKAKEEADKKLLTLEITLGILSVAVLFIPIIIGVFVPVKDWVRLIIVFSGFIPSFVGFFMCLKIEQVAGYYQCKHCKHKYMPTYKAMVGAMHMGRTRYMKCPACNKRSWQKKVISKED